VVLPDKNKRFSVDVIDNSTVTLHPDGSLTALTLGNTDIVVNDDYIIFEAHELNKRPSRMITVVDPSAVRIQLNGNHELNVLEEGK
jgi:hypothetical protein